MRRWQVGWALWLVLLAPAERAWALVGDRDDVFGADGSLRTITGASYNYEHPLIDQRSDGFSQTILRLELGGRPSDWLRVEIHGVQDLNLTTSSSAMGFGQELFSGADSVRYRIADAAWQWGDEERVRARMWLDRFNLQMALPFADVTVGRQAITFGKAHFWNPLDVFLAFDPRQFDRDYKSGVDAVRVDIPLGDFSGVTLVGVAGRGDPNAASVDDFELTWYGSALLARVFGTIWDWDFSLQGGKVFGGYQVGAAAAGELGPVELRAEGAFFIAAQDDPLPDHFTGVLGLGHRFEFDLLVEVEYLYNGAGDADRLVTALQRVMDARSFHMGEHLFGLVAQYEILPILQGSLAWIFSISDDSSLLQPGLVLSVADEADFIFGALIALGARPLGLELKSEFGSYPNFAYMEFKFYF